MSLRRVSQKCFLLNQNHQCNRLFVRFKKKPVTPESTEQYLDPEVHSNMSSNVTLLSQEGGNYVTKYSGLGFTMSNGLQLAGPSILFPRKCLKWKIYGYRDINEKTLSLFGMLSPKLDLLIIGTGSKKRELSKETVEFLNKNKISFEVLSTYQAIGGFNFQNNDQRWIAAALVPPEKGQNLTQYISNVYDDVLDSTDFIYSDEKHIPQIDDKRNKKNTKILQNQTTSEQFSVISEESEAEVKAEGEVVNDSQVKIVKSPLGQGINYLSEDAYDVTKGPVNKVGKD